MYNICIFDVILGVKCEMVEGCYKSRFESSIKRGSLFEMKLLYNIEIFYELANFHIRVFVSGISSKM